MIQPISASHTIPISNLLRASTGGSKISVPLQSGMYTSFKHVFGVPSMRDGDGISVFKLKILDNLIDRLVKLKDDKVRETDITRIKPEAVDALIEQYKKELHRAVTTQAVSYGRGFAPETGIILNLLV